MYLTAIQAREFRLNVCIYSICIQRNVSFALVCISFEYVSILCIERNVSFALVCNNISNIMIREELGEMNALDSRWRISLDYLSVLTM
jgi:hypothetical protein